MSPPPSFADCANPFSPTAITRLLEAMVDFGAVVLHVFLQNARQYYDLEGFWSEAPRVDVDESYGKGVVDGMRASHDANNTEAAIA